MIPSLRHSHRYVLAVGMLIGTISGRAQDWEVFDMASAGLPSNLVRAIAHDGTGNTWVATDWGLCRYDGSAWEVFQQGTSGLPENDVRAIACDGEGRVWIGLFTQGLVVYDGSSWEHFAPGTSPLPADHVRNIAFDPQGYAWLATTSGVVRTDLTEWRIYNDTDESYGGLILPGVNIADVAVRADGLVCLGTLNAGFVYLTETQVLFYNSVNDGLPDNTALGVAVDANGDRWAACPSGGLLRNFGDWAGGFWSHYITSTSGIPSNSLNDIAIDALDRKLIATQAAGVAVLSGLEEWEYFTVQNSDLPDNEVLCASIGTDGAYWVGTATGGAARLDPSVDLPELGREVVPITVFPVPATDVLNVDLGRELDTRTAYWAVHDVLGGVTARGVWRPHEQGRLDLSHFTPGAYRLVVKSEKVAGTARFIVQ